MSEETMYTLVHGETGEPIAYRYGESWVMMQLMMEGGFPTREEAIDHWNEYKARRANHENRNP